MNNNDPYNTASKSINELLRMKAGHNPDTLEYQHAEFELEKRQSASKQNIAPNEPKKTSKSIHDIWEKPLGKIAIGVIIGLLIAMTIWVINHYLSLNLK